jgi:hypothetical protein
LGWDHEIALLKMIGKGRALLFLDTTGSGEVRKTFHAERGIADRVAFMRPVAPWAPLLWAP